MCTSLGITCHDGTILYGRTMEFAEDLHSSLLFFRKGTKYQGHTKFATKNGRKWVTKYDFCGMGTHPLPLVTDGMNAQGLAVGVLFFPNYAQYQPLAATPENTLSANEVATYLLGMCQTVMEVREALQGLNVVGVPLLPETNPSPLHWCVHDAHGGFLVIEYGEEGLQARAKTRGLEGHASDIKVLTNAPAYDWHLTNLKNYVHLSPYNHKNGFGQGTGMLGLPGDFTPPSRFVRAAFLAQYSETPKDGTEGVNTLFHLMNSFDIPKGLVRDKEILTHKSEYTQWTVVANLTEKIYHWKTYNDPYIQSRMI
jgi:choloylglycine hydrolase